MSDRPVPETGKPLTDAAIEAALADTDVIPELVSWHGESRVRLRIQTGIGHYAETTLTRFMDHDALVWAINRCAEDLEAA